METVAWEGLYAYPAVSLEILLYPAVTSNWISHTW